MIGLPRVDDLPYATGFVRQSMETRLGNDHEA